MNFLISTANYKSEHDTIFLLEQIKLLSETSIHSFTFLIFDNSNTFELPHSCEQLNITEKFNYKVLKPKKNIGLAPTWKVSIKNFLSCHLFDALILINNDTIFKDNFFNGLSDAIKQHPSAVFGPAIYLPDESIWSIGGAFGRLPWIVNHYSDDRLVRLNKTSIEPTEHLSGCCLIISRGAIKDYNDIVGLSDFFFRGEEWFLNKKFSELNIDKYILSDVKLIHNENGSHERFSEAHIYWAIRAKMLFIKKLSGKDYFLSICSYTLHIFSKGLFFYKNNSDLSFNKVLLSIFKAYKHGLFKNVVREIDLNR